MYKLVKIDLLDAFIYADIFDDEAYTLVKESEDIEELLDLAIERFKIANPSFKDYKDWERDAEDGGYEIEIMNDDFDSLFRGSLLLVDPIVESAFKLAQKYHYGQTRKGDNLSYIIHILQISSLVYNKGKSEVDPDILAASICHDLLEDTDCPEKEVEEACGAEVLRIVKAVSNDENLKDLKDWEEKKEKYVSSVEAGGFKSMSVCLCDKIANMNAFFNQYEKEGATLWAKFNRGKDKKIWFEKEVLAMLKRNDFDSPLLKTYEDMIEKFEVLAE